MPKSTNESELGYRFQRLAVKLASPAPDPVFFERLTNGWFNVLAGLYGRPDRAYHTFEHVRAMLERFDRVRASTTEAGQLAHGFELEIETAIWFHDAVYEPGSFQNESESAWLALSFLRTVGAPDEFSNRVRIMIEQTTHRAPHRLDGPVGILLDLDLASLADAWDDFRRNNANIRKEQAGVSDETYRWGQVRFLANLMGRPSIFHVLTELEQPARRNVERHLVDLMADRL